MTEREFNAAMAQIAADNAEMGLTVDANETYDRHLSMAARIETHRLYMASGVRPAHPGSRFRNLSGQPRR